MLLVAALSAGAFTSNASAHAAYVYGPGYGNYAAVDSLHTVFRVCNSGTDGYGQVMLRDYSVGTLDAAPRNGNCRSTGLAGEPQSIRMCNDDGNCSAWKPV